MLPTQVWASAARAATQMGDSDASGGRKPSPVDWAAGSPNGSPGGGGMPFAHRPAGLLCSHADRDIALRRERTSDIALRGERTSDIALRGERTSDIAARGERTSEIRFRNQRTSIRWRGQRISSAGLRNQRGNSIAAPVARVSSASTGSAR